MSWMSNWVERILGKRSVTAQVESIVAKVEPTVWEIIEGRIPMGSPQEVHGYVWASSFPIIRSAACQLANDLDADALTEVVQKARVSVADRIVSQLEIYAAESPKLQRAA